MRDYKSGVNYARKEGMQEGERNNSLEIAKKMLENDEEIEKIEKYTKLAKEEIEKLRNRK